MSHFKRMTAPGRGIVERLDIVACFEVALGRRSDYTTFWTAIEPIWIYTDDPAARHPYLRQRRLHDLHGGIITPDRVIRNFTDRIESIADYERQLQAHRQCLIVPIDDQLFAQVERKYLLDCERHILVPIGDIPDQLQMLYFLKFEVVSA